MLENIRVRFAPSPTGPLHMGGVRTALYNYLFARKHNGAFILRIEDTDQARSVPAAEQYIIDALKWCGITPDEGMGFGGGEVGPYKQSERSAIYAEYAQKLIEKGKAYMAFDTPEELENKRQEATAAGAHSWQYDSSNRMQMNNSLSLSKEAVSKKITDGESYVVRIMMPEDLTVSFDDIVRGTVTFNTSLLDDKVLMKGDGLPTYHLANVVDDYMMKISHVIRGEEWLPSTPLHVMLYRFFDWENEMPQFAHLPLILRPDGKGKLSKRDGDRLGFPVFPLNWKDEKTGEESAGFKERGFFPEAFINILALLGWHPEGEQELFTLEELVSAFSLERVSKAGAKFDFDKAVWFNEQYLRNFSDDQLAHLILESATEKGYGTNLAFLSSFCGMMKERVTFPIEFFTQGYYFFEPVKEFDQKTIRKKWKPERISQFTELKQMLSELDTFNAEKIEKAAKEFMETNNFGFGDVLPILRVALTGTLKGPPVFEMMELLGKEEIVKRLERAYVEFGTLAAAD